MVIFLRNRHFKDNVIFLAISVFIFSSEPAIAQQNQQNPYNPINFTQPLSLSRGSLSPASLDAVYLNNEETCRLVQELNGWLEESCKEIENIIFEFLPTIDNIIIDKPNSEGYVKLDDWNSDDREEQIEIIWNQLGEGLTEQSKRLGIKIVPLNWVVYPTLNREKSYLYYAYLLDWDGEKTVNIKATLFDREGYVVFSVVPVSSQITEAEINQFVERILASYVPDKSQSYLDFKDGDKIAAAGAIGVLATLIGVKYGKAATSGIIALLLLFAKKFWFLIFLPFIFLIKLIFRGKNK